MSYDSVLKFLVEQSPVAFIQWLLNPKTVQEWEILTTELNLEPIRADALFFLRVSSCILHLEFQTLPRSRPPIPLKMLDYWVRLYRQYRCEIRQVVVFLKPSSSPEVFINQFQFGNTTHSYSVIRIWEIEPEQFLSHPSLLPLAILAKTDTPEQLLRQVAIQVDRIEDSQQKSNISACVQLLAGIKFEKNFIQAYFREEIMKESVIYQGILEKGRQEGEISLILKQLHRRFGTLEPRIEAQIRGLSVEKLEELGESLLDFSTKTDYLEWSKTNFASSL